MPQRRIGMFGGSFDPPHMAHVALARAAIEQLALDELRIVPTGGAWHKSRTLTEPAHRLAMAHLAFEGLPGVVVDDREIRRDGPSYTVDTLRELHAEQPGAQLWLVMGADQAQAFGSWREPQEIARLAIISIAERPRADVPSGAFDAAHLPQGRWQSIELPPMDLSATDIRQELAAGRVPLELVPGAVARYIDQHHLYSPT